MSGEELASDMIRSTVIILLYEKPLHGYGIMRSVKQRLGRDVSPSLVYPFLHQLEERGLVRSSLRPVGRRPKKVYELTEEGGLLALRIFRRLASLVSVAIEPTLTICAHCGAKLYEGGHREVIDGKEAVFCCIHCFQAHQEERNPIKEHSHTHPPEAGE
jgi:DNA-binding PadR family transcriptional regulator/ribosomal protein L24E